MHPLAALAKKAVEQYVRTGTTPDSPAPMDDTMKQRAGVFVCIKKRGELRGCIGTIMPTTENVATEVIRNAVCAATEDRRFQPVSAGELPELDYSVDVLMPPEPVEDLGDLDPARYGVIVSVGLRRGLLLPDLEGVDTVERQLEIAIMKAGIAPGEKGIKVERFEVKRYS